MKEELIGKTVEISIPGGWREYKILDIAEGLIKLQDINGIIYWKSIGTIPLMRLA